MTAWDVRFFCSLSLLCSVQKREHDGGGRRTLIPLGEGTGGLSFHKPHSSTHTIPPFSLDTPLNKTPLYPPIVHC